jgi:hypothetical protein
MPSIAQTKFKALRFSFMGKYYPYSEKPLTGGPSYREFGSDQKNQSRDQQGSQT